MKRTLEPIPVPVPQVYDINAFASMVDPRMNISTGFKTKKRFKI